MTQDNITLPTDRSNLPATFTAFLQIVKDAIAQGKQETTEGPIVQPNHVYAYCEGSWKLARYIDGRRADASPPAPKDFEPDQWELYCLAEDPDENINLVTWRDGEPVLAPNRVPESWNLTEQDIAAQLNRLRQALADAMARVGYAPNGGPARKQEQSSERIFAQHDFNAP